MATKEEIKEQIELLQEKLKQVESGIPQVEEVSSRSMKELRYHCGEYVNAVMVSETMDLDDEEHWVFSAAMKMIYGDNIFETLRKYWE